MLGWEATRVGNRHLTMMISITWSVDMLALVDQHTSLRTE